MKPSDKYFENMTLSKEWKDGLYINKHSYSVRKRKDKQYMVGKRGY